jgi:hypothetical protein
MEESQRALGATALELAHGRGIGPSKDRPKQTRLPIITYLYAGLDGWEPLSLL